MIKCIHKSIIIYGAGYLAHKLYEALKLTGMESKVIGVVTTTGSNEIFEGYEIKRFDPAQIPSDAVIYVAMNEVFTQDIEGILQQNGLKYVWCGATQILEIAAGKTIKHNKNIAVKSILKSNQNFALAIRWLVVDQYYGGNSIGNDVYVKFWRRVADENTAYKRLESFKEMIANKDRVLCAQQPIMIDTNNECLNGNHRLSLFSYFSEPVIKCDVYDDRYTSAYKGMFHDMYMKKRDVIGNSSYNNDEKEALLRIYEKVLGQYEKAGDSLLL